MCGQNCKKEFDVRNFKLWHWSTDDLTKSSWIPLPVLMVSRAIVAVLFSSVLVYNIITRNKFFIFFTNWNFAIVTAFFIAAFVISLLQFRFERNQHNQISRENLDNNTERRNSVNVELSVVLPERSAITKYGNNKREPESESRNTERQPDVLHIEHKSLWLLYNVAANISLMLTIGYWTVIYEKGELITVISIIKHLLVAVFCVVDTVISGIPVRIYHALFPLVFAATYILFTVIYWLAGGTDTMGNSYIYKALDYYNMTAAKGVTVAVFLFIVVPVNQLLYYGINTLRDRLASNRSVFPVTGQQ